MTYKQQIIDLISLSDSPLSCSELTKTIISTREIVGNKARYLSGCIATVLKTLFNKGVLEYGEQKGSKGGHTYKLKH